MECLYETVKAFLNRFKTKAKIFGIRYRLDREKNISAMDELNISAKDREKIVNNLTPEDYFRGPQPNVLNNDGDLWEFGKRIKTKEAYIKIAEGETDKSPVCISFHPAEKKINYPFKAKKDKNNKLKQ